MTRRIFLRSAFWIGLYFVMAMAPLLAMLIGPIPPGRGFWREFSVGIGFAGLSMMGLQFFLTGRFKNITAPYGIDVVYHFHRAISLIAFSLILLHAVIIPVSSPETLILLHPASTPWWMASGAAGLLAFAVVLGTSLYRVKLGLVYERWRIIHGYVSVAAVALAMLHVVGVGYYAQGPAKRGLWIVLTTAWVLALVYVRVIKPWMIFRHPYRIDEVVREHGSSWTLTLCPEGHRGMKFNPGQFAWLTIGKPLFTIREHPFSFSSSAMETDRIRMTIKELGDFTSRIGEVAPGTRAYLDGPYGTFTIDQRAAAGYVFLAGGVGVTPVMSILRTMADRHDARPALLIYGSRMWEDVTFREELEGLTARLNLRVVHVLEEPPADWRGEHGRVTAELLARHLPDNRMEQEYFICGPEPMQKAIREALDRLGLPMDHVQSESFNFV
ncbi:MAG: ferric reductase-like transmembrane domain-containing protein [Desulfobulbaceae bacterium]|nr:ferric reductase-like transmembrane domain-containing protein [Desulfobulbaceae bacterium]